MIVAVLARLLDYRLVFIERVRVTRKGENRLKALSPMYSRTPASSSEISPFFLKNAPDTQGIFLFGISGMRLHSELYVWLLAEHTYDSMASTLAFLLRATNANLISRLLLRMRCIYVASIHLDFH